MATITPEVARKLAQSWVLYPQYRAHFDELLNDYLGQLAQSARSAELVALVEVAAFCVNSATIETERAGKREASASA